MIYKTFSFEEMVDLVIALGPPPKGTKTVHGPGRSGRIVAEIFATIHGLSVEHSAAHADMIVDDEVFTGRTFFRFREMFPDKPFWALIWNAKRMHRVSGGKSRLPVFRLGPKEKAAIVDPRHRAFLPLKGLGPYVDGAHILQLVTEKRKGK